MTDWVNQIHHGDCRTLMRRMIADGVQVQCVVSSPPYWGLRDYGHERQFGLEATPRAHILRLRNTFRLVNELLRKDGVLWLNYGDSYASSGGSGWQGTTGQRADRRKVDTPKKKRTALGGMKPKDLLGLAWKLAFALQDDGWYFRSPIIWHKLNPMPESAKDRPTTAHEYIFLMSKRRKYYYDGVAIREPASADSHARRARAVGTTFQAPGQHPHGGILKARSNSKVGGWAHGPGLHTTIDHNTEREADKAAANLRDVTKFQSRTPKSVNMEDSLNELSEDRNMRTVWTFASEAFKGAHFATFPRALVERCILAGTKPGDIVFDPFMGTGTVAEVATSLGRRFIGCEISAKYIKMFKRYRSSQIGLAL